MLRFTHFSQTGEPISNQYPHLNSIVTNTLEEIDADHIANTSELVFLATPPGVSKELTPGLLRKGLKVIDLSGDFRMKKIQMSMSNGINDRLLGERI
ncbi:hypothetical protein GCM10020331_041820 [Ectobacillus funiculus]